MTKKFKYVETAERILEDVKGELASGDLLPRVPELKARHGVSEITIKKALALLVERGIVKRIQKKGTVLLRAYDQTADPPPVRATTLRILTLNSEWPFTNHIENVLKRYCAVNKTVTYRIDRVGNLGNYPELLGTRQYDFILVGTRLTGQMTLNPSLVGGFEAIDQLPGIWLNPEDYLERTLRWCRDEAGLLCLPFYYSLALDRVNLDYPTRDRDAFAGGLEIHRYLEMLRRVVSEGRGPITTPLYFHLFHGAFLMRLFGADLFSPDYRKCVVGGSATLQCLDYMLDLIQRERFCPPPGMDEGLGVDAFFGSGKFLRAWTVCGVQMDQGHDFGNRLVPLPTGRRRVTPLTWAGAMVPKGARLDVVADFFNFCRLAENARTMTETCPGIPCEKIHAEEHVEKMERRVEGFSLFLSELDHAEPLNNAPDPVMIDRIYNHFKTVVIGVEEPEEACAKIRKECDERLRRIFNIKSREPAASRM